MIWLEESKSIPNIFTRKAMEILMENKGGRLKQPDWDLGVESGEVKKSKPFIFQASHHQDKDEGEDEDGNGDEDEKEKEDSPFKGKIEMNKEESQALIGARKRFRQSISSNDNDGKVILSGNDSRKSSSRRNLHKNSNSSSSKAFKLEYPPAMVNHRWEFLGFDKDYLAQIPYVLMGYLQFFFNFCLICIILYIIVQFIWTVQRDVDIKVEEHLTDIMNEIASCAKNYLENKCDPILRVPAMEKPCITWETCMNRDPAVIGRAKVSAETFAEIINSFVEPISYKTMVFFVLTVFAVFFLCNFAFHMVSSRHKTQNDHLIYRKSDNFGVGGNNDYRVAPCTKGNSGINDEANNKNTSSSKTIVIPPPSAITNHYYGISKKDLINKMDLD